MIAKVLCPVSVGTWGQIIHRHQLFSSKLLLQSSTKNKHLEIYTILKSKIYYFLFETGTSLII